MVDKSGKKATKSISYILQFIDSARYMASSLSNLVNNLAKGIHKIKCKCGYDNKKCKICGIKYKDCECCLEYTRAKNDLIEYQCLYCSKNCQK